MTERKKCPKVIKIQDISPALAYMLEELTAMHHYGSECRTVARVLLREAVEERAKLWGIIPAGIRRIPEPEDSPDPDGGPPPS
jgi:hypothetical protein